MNIAIIGYATEGKASAAYFSGQGHEITVCDANPDTVVPVEFQAQLGDGYLEGLDRFDTIVRSAGIHPRVILSTNPGVENQITTAINEFIVKSPSRNIIGITGTKGKGTTSTLTARILETHGKTVWLGGNIGRSPLEFIDEIAPDDWVVLELSSFQLYDLKQAPHIAACLMVAPEHLAWHANLEDYYEAKARLFRQQKRDDVAIYFSDSEATRSIATQSPGKHVPYFAPPGAYVANNDKIMYGSEVICSTSDLKLLGKHNWQNVCAAITASWQANCKDVAKIKQAVTSFAGLPHRLEFVRTVDGVDYYDDSFGTTPETAIVAVQAFEQPKILILGGSDKGVSFDELARVVSKQNIRHAVLIGATAHKLQKSLTKAGFKGTMTTGLDHMTDMVRDCATFARAGDVVLLSTGCASFGLFANYKDRGEQFTKAVQALSLVA
ncbi:UDP-N-acetylmuramoyl-L-alanine--D-glutamate ligase [Patescibacteria group bacterium]|nr:MAG: UDP-N-acetylmuramoyl-L-alanine--D-glutamate ligase [Patescibacteria group bacterium]